MPSISLLVITPSQRLRLVVDASSTVGDVLAKLPRTDGRPHGVTSNPGNHLGNRLLSQGPRLLWAREQEILSEILERSSDDIEVTLTDFSLLAPAAGPAGSICQIPDPAKRGITMEQLVKVERFVAPMAPLWCETFGDASGQPLDFATVNNHHLCTWVVRPSTRGIRGDGDYGCSFVELMAAKAEEQLPLWYLSYAWLVKFGRLVACLGTHAQVRGLSLQVPYWDSLYAHNQHDIVGDPHDPRDWPAYRALRSAEGMLLVVDDQNACFTRVHCGMELALVVASRHSAKACLLDVPTIPVYHYRAGFHSWLSTIPVSFPSVPTIPVYYYRAGFHSGGTALDGHSSILTQGLAGRELQMAPLRGMYLKASREAGFPTHHLRAALALDITCSRGWNSNLILNFIAFPKASKKARRNMCDHAPPMDHPNYDRVNRAIGAHFALACWYEAEKAGNNEHAREEYARILQADEDREVVELSFTGCSLFSDHQLHNLISHLPPALRVLRLDLAFTGLHTLHCLETLREMTTIVKLSLSFTGSRNLCNIDGLGLGLQGMPQLRELELCFLKLLQLVDISALVLALPCLNLSQLDLTVDSCPRLMPSSVLEIEKVAQRLKWRRRTRTSLTLQARAPDAQISSFWPVCGCASHGRKPMDHMDHYNLKSPEDLIALLEEADIRLVRGKFLLKLHQKSETMIRRQELETQHGHAAIGVSGGTTWLERWANQASNLQCVSLLGIQGAPRSIRIPIGDLGSAYSSCRLVLHWLHVLISVWSSYRRAIQMFPACHEAHARPLCPWIHFDSSHWRFDPRRCSRAHGLQDGDDLLWTNRLSTACANHRAEGQRHVLFRPWLVPSGGTVVLEPKPTCFFIQDSTAPGPWTHREGAYGPKDISRKSWG